MACALDPWGQLPSPTLSRFLERTVLIPREDTSEVLKVKVLPEVERTLQAVHRRDERFTASFLRSGSYIERLKVSEPNEFDFLVQLEGVCVKEQCWKECVSLPENPPDGAFVPVLLDEGASGASGWCAANVSDAVCAAADRQTPDRQTPDRQTLLPSHHLCSQCSVPLYLRGVRMLNPDKVMSIFQKLVADVALSIPGSMTVYRRKTESPAVTLKIPSKEDIIDVDLVPFIKNPYHTWSFNWPRSDQIWPSQDKMQEVKETGVDLVAKHHYFWRYSFSRIERVLFEKIDEDEGHRRDSLRILKKVREDLWEPKFGKVLVSYHLKTVLFWACEKWPTSYAWRDLAQSFTTLVDELIHYLSEGHLPHYFLAPDVNLLKAPIEDLNAVLEEGRRFRAAPMKYFK